MLFTLTCLAALENPRIGDPVEKPKTVTVDAQIYLNGSTPALVGCLRWYNKDDFKFPESEIGGFQLWIQVRTFTSLFFQVLNSDELSGISHV